MKQILLHYRTICLIINYCKYQNLVIVFYAIWWCWVNVSWNLMMFSQLFMNINDLVSTFHETWRCLVNFSWHLMILGQILMTCDDLGKLFHEIWRLWVKIWRNLMKFDDFGSKNDEMCWCWVNIWWNCLICCQKQWTLGFWIKIN